MGEFSKAELAVIYHALSDFIVALGTEVAAMSGVNCYRLEEIVADCRTAEALQRRLSPIVYPPNKADAMQKPVREMGSVKADTAAQDEPTDRGDVGS